MKLTPEFIEKALEVIGKDYERVDNGLASMPANSDASNALGVIFTELNSFQDKGSSINRASTHGVISFPDKSNVEALIGEQVGLAPKPDVVYIQKENLFDMPQMNFSPTILPYSLTMEAKMNIVPTEFKRARTLFYKLARFQAWSNNVAIEGYRTLAHNQREFINTLDPFNHQVYSMDDLAIKLNLSYSSIFRIFKPRIVSIQSLEGKVTELPATDLFCTKDDKKKYVAFGMLNPLFEKEAETRDCMSDEELSGLTGVNRRTIANYRLRVGIPNRHERREEYLKNASQRYSFR